MSQLGNGQVEDGRAPRVPRATYRLQLQPAFDFAAAAAIADYLAGLGVSHVYARPICRLRRAARTATTSSTRSA